MAEGYAESPVRDEVVYQKKLRVAQEYFSPNMSVFEFACGTGRTAIAHAAHVNHVLATDFSENMLKIAKENARVAGAENITFELTSIEALDAGTKSFDAVIGLSVLHLLEDKQRAIKKAHELLKPGGVFISSTPCLSRSSFRFKCRRVIAHWFGVGPLVRFYSAAQLEEAVVEAGFAIERRWEPSSDPLKSLFLIARKCAEP